MKIKSLLLGMLACAAFTACTNDDLVENETPGQDGKEVPAYVTLSFTAKTTGDGRAVAEYPTKPEDTGIENAGTANEQAVNSILYVVGDKFKYVTDVDGEFTEAGGIYTSTNPIKVLAGEHEVCVIINPCAELIAETTKTGVSATAVLAAIKTGTYTGATWEAAINAVTKAESATDNANFMMGNRELAKFTATDKHTQENPLTVSVSVERAVAKIMYRTKNTGNVYTVPVTTVKQTLVTKTIAGTVYTNAFDQASQEVWVTLKKEEDKDVVDKVYSISGETVTELVRYSGTGITPDVPYYTLGTGQNFTYAHTTVESKENLTVTLTGFALTNIQNKMFYVRHTSTDGLTSEPFGLLTGTNYLFDPCFAEKTEANLKTSAFFFNPFRTYDFAAANAFQTLPAEGDGDISSDDSVNPGGFMAYTFENAAPVAMQKHGYSTSVTFKAVAKTADGTPFEAYVYKGNIYKSLKDGLDANPNTKESDFSVYEDGVCYYTAQIKHLDNDMDSAMGNMEFAIVRNNIYSLQVTKLAKLGDAKVDQDPTINDETGEGYIKLAVNILPWRVRYNDIEF